MRKTERSSPRPGPRSSNRPIVAVRGSRSRCHRGRPTRRCGSSSSRSRPATRRTARSSSGRARATSTGPPRAATRAHGRRSPTSLSATLADEPVQLEVDPILGIRSLLLHPQYPERRELYVSTGKGVFHSVDDGISWTPTGPTEVGMLSMSPEYATDGTVYAGTGHGLSVTRDSGVTLVARRRRALRRNERHRGGRGRTRRIGVRERPR